MAGAKQAPLKSDHGHDPARKLLLTDRAAYPRSLRWTIYRVLLQVLLERRRRDVHRHPQQDGTEQQNQDRAHADRQR